MNILQSKRLLLSMLIIIGALFFLSNAAKPSKVEQFIELRDLTSATPVPVQQWKSFIGEAADACKIDFDDSRWQTVDFNYNWGMHPTCWFRKEVTIPQDMAGQAVWMNIIVDDKGTIYVDGQKRCRFDWYGKAFLTARAKAGDKFLVCIKGWNGQGSGHLVSTELQATTNFVRYEIDKKMDDLKSLTHVDQEQENQWRFHVGENDRAADANFDDSDWPLVDIGNRWEIENSVSWLRKQVIIPEKVNGLDITGSTVTFTVNIDDFAEIYLNGKPTPSSKGRRTALVLTTDAKPGEKFFLAIKGANLNGSGVLHDARMTYSILQPITEQAGAYLKKMTGLTMLVERIPNPNPIWGKSMIASLTLAGQWRSTTNLATCQRLLSSAEKKLAPVQQAALEYPIQIKGPYLQNVTSNSMTIMWETDSPGDSRINYGTSENLTQSVYSPEKVTIHTVTLNNLQPETKYHYRAISGKLSSTLNRFRTAINRDTPFRFVVWGDNHTNGPRFEQNVNRMIPYQPDLAISVGDMVLTGSNYDLWGYEFFIPGRNLFKNTPLFTTLGNHEYGGYSPGNPVEWFEKFFSLPGKEYYYSYDYGNSHFIHLNPHTNSPFGIIPGSEQYQWLISDLESTASKNATWRFVFFHEPPMSEPLLVKHIVPLLEKYQVTMQFSGHFHTFVREQRPKPDGPIYIITGGGGGSLSDGSKRNNELKVDMYKAVHHFCLIDINGETLSFQAIDIDGNVFDNLTIKK